MKRRNFIQLAGYGGVGLVAAWGTHTPAKTTFTEPLNLTTFSFETINVDARGKERQRFTRQAEFFTEDLGHTIALPMVSIVGDRFTMGASPREKASLERERPLHQVKVDNFFLSKYPITQIQWRIVASFPKIHRELNPNPSHFQGDSLPVESISWWEAQEFCDRLSAHTGKPYRLPSETEWEYACRGKTKTPFAFGATLTSELADYLSTYAYASETGVNYRQSTTPVGSFMPNAFGVYDLHGNVSEWCADSWHENYYRAPTNSQTWIKGGKSEWRTLRGGSWANIPSHCRSAHRSGYPADSLNRAIGFRVAMSL